MIWTMNTCYFYSHKNENVFTFGREKKDLTREKVCTPWGMPSAAVGPSWAVQTPVPHSPDVCADPGAPLPPGPLLTATAVSGCYWVSAPITAQPCGCPLGIPAPQPHSGTVRHRPLPHQLCSFFSRLLPCYSACRPLTCGF